MARPDLEALTVSWELTPRADGDADNAVTAYQNAVRSLGGWLAEHHPGVAPAGLDRDHVRGWLVHLRETRSSSTARGWFAGVRHFCRWLQAEGEADHDATAGIRTPAPRPASRACIRTPSGTPGRTPSGRLGNEGDLMLLGGWRNRALLDRYGKAAAADRAADAYRRLSLAIDFRDRDG